jgi:cellulose biosynthesis protein BcsQ
MSHVLASYSIKGGVGKTSAAVNLAWLAARDGRRTLLWDLDPQAAATFLLRVEPNLQGGARKLVRLRSPVAELIRESDRPGLDLLPADFSLRHLDLALDREPHSEQRLGQILAPLRDEYDLVILDCAPSISLVSESVFELADVLLSPVIPAALSVRTFGQLLERAHRLATVLGFFSMVDVSRPLHRSLIASLRGELPDYVLGAAIPLREEIERMGTELTPVGELAPGSRGAEAYEALWWDLRTRVRGL